MSIDHNDDVQEAVSKRERYVKAAREKLHRLIDHNDVQVDDPDDETPAQSMEGDGAWVRAWVWVYASDIEEEADAR